jgi:hypothetical protein
MNDINLKSLIKTITPAVAKEMLKTNVGNNRTADHSHVVNLAHQMRLGQWMMNGAPIVIDELGNVIDGQHRLMAIIKSQCSIPMLIIAGVKSESFMTIDTGKKRSPGNMFQISGIKSGTASAAAVANVINYRRAIAANKGNGGSLNTGIRPSAQDLIAEYNANPEVYSSAVKMAGRLKKICAPSVASTLYSLAVIEGGHPIEKAESFWLKMMDGDNLAKNDPILVFRNKLIDNKNSKAKLHFTDQLMVGIKAWNAHVLGRSISYLKTSINESCPKIV